MKTFKPLADQILVEVLDQSSTTADGLSIPDSGKESSQQGIVRAIGRGAMYCGMIEPVECAVDDHVYFRKFAGTEITVNGTKYQLMRESDLLGILK